MSEATPEAAAATEAPANTQPEQPAAAEAPKPTETVEFWRDKAREQERRAKSNAEAAKRLAEIEDAQKSAEQRAAEALAKAQADARQAVVEGTRYKVAATHGIGADFFGLLGNGDEEAMVGNATVVADLLSARNERDQLKAELEALKQNRPSLSTSRPTASLQPGATPTPVTTEDDAYPAHWVNPTRSN